MYFLTLLRIFCKNYKMSDRLCDWWAGTRSVIGEYPLLPDPYELSHVAVGDTKVGMQPTKIIT